LITSQDVARWYQDISGQAKAARNALTILSGLMLYAEDHGLRPAGSNPCRGLRKKAITQRGSHLPNSTVRALWRALDRLQLVIPDGCDAIRLLLLTGARRSEILGLEWDRIIGSRAVLEDSKTGPRTVWLCTAACHILDRRRLVTDSAFVFPGPTTRRPITVIDREWKRVLREAGIKALRVHDLRHHFASVAVSNGVDLRVIGQLLGHKDIESTLGYAHLATEALVKSAGRVSTVIGNAMLVDDGQIRSALALPSAQKKSRVKPRVAAWKAVALRTEETGHA
jgi:integrase